MIQTPYMGSDKGLRDQGGKKYITWNNPIEIEQYTQKIQ